MGCCPDLPERPRKAVKKTPETSLADLKYSIPHTLAVVHPDGSIEYVKKGDWPEINGYEKVGDVFKPLWPECFKRLQGASVRGGVIQLKMVCNNKEAEHHTQFVDHTACVNCPVRQS